MWASLALCLIDVATSREQPDREKQARERDARDGAVPAPRRQACPAELLHVLERRLRLGVGRVELDSPFESGLVDDASPGEVHRFEVSELAGYFFCLGAVGIDANRLAQNCNRGGAVLVFDRKRQ